MHIGESRTSRKDRVNEAVDYSRALRVERKRPKKEGTDGYKGRTIKSINPSIRHPDLCTRWSCSSGFRVMYIGEPRTSRKDRVDEGVFYSCALIPNERDRRRKALMGTKDSRHPINLFLGRF